MLQVATISLAPITVRGPAGLLNVLSSWSADSIVKASASRFLAWFVVKKRGRKGAVCGETPTVAVVVGLECHAASGHDKPCANHGPWPSWAPQRPVFVVCRFNCQGKRK